MNQITLELVNAEQILPRQEIIEDNPEIINYIKDQLFSTIIRTIIRKYTNENIMWKFTCRQHKVYSSYVIRATAKPIMIEEPFLSAYREFTLKERIQRAWCCFKQKSNYKNL